MKEFKLTSWSIDNATSVFIITILITLAGIMSYNSLPKEQFPDVVVPTIFVSTIYPGASPSDMEQLVTRPIEKQLKGISGVKKVSSYSVQDFSSIIVEFNTSLDVPLSKQKVKDAVDKAKRDLPQDLLDDPTISEFDISEIPIMNVNIAGDFSLDKLKDYADAIQDKIEGMREITRVDMIGALDREIHVEVDKYKMAAASLTFRDIENALAFENMTISAGNVDIGGMTRSVSIRGDFKDVEQIKNILISSQSGAQMYLKDVADVHMGYKEQESYSRLNGRNVISLNVIKRTGENLIDASDKIKVIVDEMKANELPPNLEVSITGDQSRATRITLHDLINTIIIGFILVTFILMFFMGATDALFVALSVPLSMCIAFMVLPAFGYTLNFVVLFAFLLALGIVVDDAIVVIENTHRVYHDEKNLNIVQAAKKAAGEVFLPVLSGTSTTLAPFFPLVFWGGIFGKFMKYLPVTVIITLTASLFVAYVINPVFAVWFMGDAKREGRVIDPVKKRRRVILGYVMYALAALYFYVNSNFFMGNLLVFIALFVVFYKFVLERAVRWFQQNGWPAAQNAYARFLNFALDRPWTMMLGVLGLFVFSLALFGSGKRNIVLFPKADPNFIYVYMTLPVGTEISVTDSLTRILEKKVTQVVGEGNPIVESIISNVALGASEDQFDRTTTSNKGKVGVAFVEFGKRDGVSTKAYMDKIREETKGLIAGAEIVVDQESGGPPQPKPISVEIRGDDFKELIRVSTSVKRYLDSLNIAGVEELRSDLIVSKPEISIQVDRDRANREGISTAQIGSEFRTAILGKEATKFKDGEEEVPVNIRLKPDQRQNINSVENLNITFRDMNMGGVLRSVPMASLADVKYTTTYGGIRRLDQSRIVTISSNITAEFQPSQNDVVNAVKAAVANFPTTEGVTVGFAGQDAEFLDAATFLGRSLVISIFIILLILITQFNSIGKTLIIMTEVVFSIIGVLLGMAMFKMDFSVIMSGVGIVALAGIVVRNGILLVEYTDILREKGDPVREAIVEAGRIRMTPVLLTATAAILGLIPLAIGFNIDFYTMFASGDPKIYLGGDSVSFWGPLSWTIIFGLSFATFVTLVILPVMYLLGWRIKNWWGRNV
ncbi:MAG: efflux RND transporter permease subunit [Saprospiraceae bacterium]|nr:efflux RND transporter permease subunit [Saprospiraceae bacterium]